MFIRAPFLGVSIVTYSRAIGVRDADVRAWSYTSVIEHVFYHWEGEL